MAANRACTLLLAQVRPTLERLERAAATAARPPARPPSSARPGHWATSSRPSSAGRPTAIRATSCGGPGRSARPPASRPRASGPMPSRRRGASRRRPSAAAGSRRPPLGPAWRAESPTGPASSSFTPSGAGIGSPSVGSNRYALPSISTATHQGRRRPYQPVEKVGQAPHFDCFPRHLRPSVRSQSPFSTDCYPPPSPFRPAPASRRRCPTAGPSRMKTHARSVAVPRPNNSVSQGNCGIRVGGVGFELDVADRPVEEALGPLQVVQRVAPRPVRRCRAARRPPARRSRRSGRTPFGPDP